PKLTEEYAHIAVEWQDLRPKYVRNSTDKPSFRIVWSATAKGEPPPEPTDDEEGLSELEKLVLRAMRGTPKTLENEVDEFLQWQSHLFGEFKPLRERWDEPKAVKTVKTKSKHVVEYIEVNWPTKKSPKSTQAKPVWYMLVGKSGLDLPDREIEVGFMGYCDSVFARDLKKEWLKVVKSFELRRPKKAAAKPNTSITDETDSKVFRERIKKEKLIKGWKALDTENYLLLYDEEVDAKKIVKRVAIEIEAIREQVYEKIFPPDKPITAVSVVRICKNRDQYMAYGGSGGSAGYWAAYEKELVFFEDRNNKEDSIAVLYHEAFHQYIYYSVGDFAPHTWFNEGHGDYFAGFEFKNGKFKKKEFVWRKDLAAKLKREGRAPPLDDWLHWTQSQYYGRNDKGLDGGDNYALGWDFVWFLRKTRNEAYAKILPTYFDTLKRFVTQDREAREKALKESLQDGEGEDGGDGGDAKPGGKKPPAGTGPGPEKGTTSDLVPEDEWTERALKAAFGAVDLEQLYKDWMNDNYK
ncbi:MAG: DUF1570 domain-containing protein, partial [Planctomycetota bacterium]